jgi:type I restriction enzyme, S subunit
MLIPVRVLPEQKEIVEQLNTIVTVKNMRQQELKKLDELVKARFVEMFGDIPYEGAFPLVQLCELANVGSSKRIYANEYVDSGIPFYRSKEIRELGSGSKPSVELFIKQERYAEIKKKYGVPKVGDILIAAIGATIGYSWIVDTDAPFYYKDGNLIILSIKNGVNSIFLNYVMQILIDDFKKKGASGSAQLALTIEKLEKLMIPFPSIELQNQFADFVAQVDKSKFGNLNRTNKSLQKHI